MIKISRLTSLAAACLLLAQPVIANDQPAVDPAAQPAAEPAAKKSKADLAAEAMREMQESELFQTYMGIMGELSPLVSSELALEAKLERIEKFDFSEPTQQRLKKLFGNARPLHFSKQKLADGDIAVDFKLDPLKYHDEPAASLMNWSGMAGRALVKSDMRRVTMTASSDTLDMDNKELTLKATGLTMASSQMKGPLDLWFGNGEARVEQVTVTPKRLPMTVQLHALRYGFDMQAKGKTVVIGYTGSIKAIKWGEDSVEDANLAVRISGLQLEALAAMNKDAKAQAAKKQVPAAQLDAALAMVMKHGVAMVKQGVVLDVDDISARYHGHKAQIKGQVKLAKLTDRDLQNFDRIMKKVQLRFDASVPLGMVRELSRTMMAKQGGEGVDKQQLDEASEQMVRSGIDTLKQNNWARLEGDVLRSTLVMNQGKLLLNGKPLSLSGGKKSAKPKQTAKRAKG
ncbi:DUF945 family protein [Chitinimonas prasina]|nr:DUF945 family protein [Chitinimonas prasina]